MKTGDLSMPRLGTSTSTRASVTSTVVAALLVSVSACSPPESPPRDAPAASASVEPSSATSSPDDRAPDGTWPPTEGTDGAWLPLPPDQLSPVETLQACGSSVTTRYLDGVDTEYQAEVSDTTTTVRYRSSVAVTEVLRADGAKVELDNTGPATEVYEDPDGDGAFDTYTVEGTGPSLLTAATYEQVAAGQAAGVPAVAYWTDGTVRVTATFPAGSDSAVPPDFAVTTTSTSLQDVCALLDAAAT